MILNITFIAKTDNSIYIGLLLIFFPLIVYFYFKNASLKSCIDVFSSIPLLDDFVPGSYSFSLSVFVVSESLSSYNTSFILGSLAPSHRRRSYAIFDAIFLKPMLVPAFCVMFFFFINKFNCWLVEMREMNFYLKFF